MKIRFFILLLSTLFYSGFSQQLVIDNQGHAGLIHDLVFLDGGRSLLSVSEDKTVRKWDVVSGSLQKTYRFELEKGQNGKIYASALSPNERFLFLGGFFDNPGSNPKAIGEIRILDLQNEKLLSPLVGHDNIIKDLVCSDDGKWLVSTSADKTIKIWDISKLTQGRQPELLAFIDGFEDHLNTIAISPSRDVIAAGDEGGFVRTWNVNDLDNVIPSRAKVHSEEVRQVKFSKDGLNLYSSGDDGKIVKWSGSGRFLGTIDELPGNINALEISQDGQYLTAMSRVGIVYDLSSETAISQFDYHTNTVSAISAAPFSTFDKIEGVYMASAGGDEKNILIWEQKSGSVVRNLVGKGRSVFAIGVNEPEQSIAIGQNNPSGNLDDIVLEKSFDLKELLLDLELTDQSTYHRHVKSAEDQYLSKESTNSLSFGGNTIYTDENKDGAVRCFTMANDDQAIIIGSTYSLNKYRTNGELLGSFLGHIGEVWSVAEYKNEGFLISGSSDQTVKIWNNSTGENLLTLFMASDNEWVIWTPQGFYEASAGGEKYIGWHINKGRNNLAEFHDVSAFQDFYHRRDVIERILSLKSFEAVSDALNVTAKPEIVPPTITWITPYETVSSVDGNNTVVKFTIESQSPVTLVKLLADGRPIVTESELNVSGNGQAEEMEISLTVPEGSNSTYTFSLFVIDENSKVTSKGRSITFVNSTELATQSPDSDGTSPIFVPASNETSRTRLTLDPVEDTQTPGNLYMVSIGVSEFANPQLNLNYAEADAESMAEMFKQQQGKMFKTVKTIKLLNENATREKILSTFQKLEQYTTIDDFVIIFIATHGMNVNDQFYIVPHDGNPNNARITCVDWRDFSDLVGNMAAKVLLFIDTCYSGQLGNNVGQKALSNTEALRKLSGKEYGVVIMAAATGYEYSLEHADWGHGAFTLSILEGIQEGKADVKKDGIIFLRELDYYLADRVRELTGGRQHPTTQKPSSISRLSLAKTN